MVTMNAFGLLFDHVLNMNAFQLLVNQHFQIVYKLCTKPYFAAGMDLCAYCYNGVLTQLCSQISKPLSGS